MIPIEIKTKVDYQIDSINGKMNIAVNNSGEILACQPSKYISISSMSVSQINPPIISNGINLILDGECLTLPGGYSYGHFEFVLTHNSNFVIEGSQESDILYKFNSFDLDGWFLEFDKIYTMPGTGYQSTLATQRWRVKYIATNLDLDLSEKLYLFYRVRGCSIINGKLFLSDTYTDYKGKLVNLESSYFSNTGENQENQIAINLLPTYTDYWSSPWPAGKYIHYEVYVGTSGNITDYTGGSVKPLLYRDSSVSPAGFYYFDGLSFVNFGESGMSSSLCWKRVVFITSSLNSQEALFVVYKAKWSGGSTGWISQAVNPKDFIISSSKTFNPCSELRIRSGTYPSRYNLHVIVGTSPNLEDYFDGGSTDDFSKIIIGYSGLIEYSTTTNITDRSKFFFYRNGAIINPGDYGFSQSEDVLVVYRCSVNYTGNDKVYMFWRAEYGTVPSSSSSSSLSSSTTYLETKIVAPDAETGDVFGCSVSIDGDYVVVGAGGKNSQAGVAYIFYRTSTNTWDTGTKIVASDAAAGDRFGCSVSISGDYVIVGSYGKSSYSGVAYIFHRTGTNTWDTGTKIVASDAAAGDYFGISVSISGDYVVVGADYKDSGYSHSGAAYIFHRTGTNTWDTGTKMVAYDAAANNQFGMSVSINGDYVAIGSPFNDTWAGAAYIFHRTGTNTWDSGTKIIASDALAYNQFGYVSINGDYIIVGSPGKNSHTGSAYIFHKTGINTWDIGTQIIALDASTGDDFGRAVSIYGDYTILGAYMEDSEGSGSGAAYIFHRTGTNTWDTGTKIVTSDAAINDYFGAKTSINGNYIVIGATGKNSYTGSVYIFYNSV